MKLILPITLVMVIFYFATVISRPFATALTILGVIVLAIFLAKVLYAMIFRD